MSWRCQVGYPGSGLTPANSSMIGMLALYIPNHAHQTTACLRWPHSGNSGSTYDGTLLSRGAKCVFITAGFEGVSQGIQRFTPPGDFPCQVSVEYSGLQLQAPMVSGHKLLFYFPDCSAQILGSNLVDFNVFRTQARQRVVVCEL